MCAHLPLLFQDTPSDHMASHVPPAPTEPQGTNSQSPSHPPSLPQASGEATAAEGGERDVGHTSSVRG